MIEIDGKDAARFWSRVEKRGPDECWPWVRGKNSAGYGVFCLKSEGRLRPTLAHRISLALATRRWPDAFALHSCDNPACCNPRHLRWGTQKDNMQDAKLRLRMSPPPYLWDDPAWREKRRAACPRGAEVHNSILTDEAVGRIYVGRLSGRTAKAVALELGLPVSVVQDVYIGRSWRHCLGVNGNPTLKQLRAAKAKPIHHKLTRDDAAAIREALAAGETGRSVALRFGVHFATVSDVKLGKIWAV